MVGQLDRTISRSPATARSALKCSRSLPLLFIDWIWILHRQMPVCLVFLAIPKSQLQLTYILCWSMINDLHLYLLKQDQPWVYISWSSTSQYYIEIQRSSSWATNKRCASIALYYIWYRYRDHLVGRLTSDVPASALLLHSVSSWLTFKAVWRSLNGGLQGFATDFLYYNQS